HDRRVAEYLPVILQAGEADRPHGLQLQQAVDDGEERREDQHDQEYQHYRCAVEQAGQGAALTARRRPRPARSRPPCGGGLQGCLGHRRPPPNSISAASIASAAEPWSSRTFCTAPLRASLQPTVGAVSGGSQPYSCEPSRTVARKAFSGSARKSLLAEAVEE